MLETTKNERCAVETPRSWLLLSRVVRALYCPRLSALRARRRRTDAEPSRAERVVYGIVAAYGTRLYIFLSATAGLLLRIYSRFPARHSGIAELAHLYVRSTYHLFCFCLLLNHFCYAKQLCSKIIKILPKFLYYSFKVFISIGENILQNSSEIYSDFTILKFIWKILRTDRENTEKLKEILSGEIQVNKCFG